MLRVLTVAAVMLFSFFPISTAHAVEVGDVACTDRDVLLLVIEQGGIPEDEDGSGAVGCTLLPADYAPNIIGVVESVKAACGLEEDATCQLVEVAEAMFEGDLYYIALGWLTLLDGDHVEDLLMAEAEPFLPIGVPCQFAGCVRANETGKLAEHVAPGKQDRLSSSKMAAVE